MVSSKRLLWSLIALVSGALSACGGGGNDVTPAPPPPPPQPATYSIGGAVSGLGTGANVVLQNNAGNNTTVSANGPFTFATPVGSGAAYAVTVLTQPAGQTCTVATGSGTATANVSNVAVTCANNAPSSFTVGGTVSGLAPGGTVALQLNGGNDLAVATNGSFAFPAGLATGAAWTVTRLSNPTVPGAGQTCNVSSGTGTIATANVTSVTVACVNNDIVAPAVVARFPYPTQVGARVSGGVVTVNFSEIVDAATVGTASVLVTRVGGSAVPGTVALSNGGLTATFTPSTRLSFDADYEATITTAVRDPSGNALAANQTWRFNTGKRISIGFLHTCARTLTDDVKCWGDNRRGQLGIDSTLSRGNAVSPALATLAPINLGAGRKVVSVTSGDYHNCAVLDNGDTKCWGSNAEGELGLGTRTFGVGDAAGEMAGIAAVDFGAGRKAIEVVGGQFFTCARLDDSSVKCWGDNADGELGQGNTADLGVAAGDIAAAPPVNLGTGLTATQLSVGHFHACAVLVDGSGARRLKCWGDNQWGQLGRGTTADAGSAANQMGDNLPALDLGAAVQSALANGGHSCALLTGGAVKCWGLNTWGQAGTSLTGSLTRPVPASCANGANDCIGDAAGEIAALTPALAASRYSVAYRHNCAITTAGEFKCWGTNEEGELGIGGIASPNDVVGDEAGEMPALAATVLKQATASVEDFTAGGFHTCVSFADATINCWGLNDQGQLGHGNVNNWGDTPGELASTAPDTNIGT